MPLNSKGGVNTEGFKNKSGPNTGGQSAVGLQGSSGSKQGLKGGKVAHVNNPNGMNPVSTGKGAGALVQGPIQPKVGK